MAKRPSQGPPIVRLVQDVVDAPGWQGARRAQAEACNRRATQPAGMQLRRIGPVFRLEVPQTKKRVRVKGSRVVVDAELPNLSETLLSFAQPLLESLSNHPPSLDEIRQAMHYASIVWNVHVIAQDDPLFPNEVLAVLDNLPDALGPKAPDILRDMLETRRTKYAHDRRFASVDVIQAEGGWTISTQGATMDAIPKVP